MQQNFELIQQILIQQILIQQILIQQTLIQQTLIQQIHEAGLAVFVEEHGQLSIHSRVGSLLCLWASFWRL